MLDETLDIIPESRKRLMLPGKFLNWRNSIPALGPGVEFSNGGPLVPVQKSPQLQLSAQRFKPVDNRAGFLGLIFAVFKTLNSACELIFQAAVKIG